MSLRLYMDHHVKRQISIGLRSRGVDLVTAEEDGCHRLADPDLLTRATALGRTLVSFDEDLLAEAARRQRAGEEFAGLIYSRQLAVTTGQAIRDLELFAKVYDPEEMQNRVEFIPL